MVGPKRIAAMSAKRNDVLPEQLDLSALGHGNTAKHGKQRTFAAPGSPMQKNALACGQRQLRNIEARTGLA